MQQASTLLPARSPDDGASKPARANVKGLFPHGGISEITSLGLANKFSEGSIGSQGYHLSPVAVCTSPLGVLEMQPPSQYHSDEA